MNDFKVQLLPNGFVRVDDNRAGVIRVYERAAGVARLRSGSGRLSAGELVLVELAFMGGRK